MKSVIPGLTKPAPYLIQGNPGFFWMPDQVRHDDQRTFYEIINFVISVNSVRNNLFVLPLHIEQLRSHRSSRYAGECWNNGIMGLNAWSIGQIA
jgi:hypothetical protein